ncbi:CoA transferase subunit A [Georgenia sp. AZ-5]|uniref:CoA transferase subunit A n=1 Tax=Georgenia sp. AZ-5 TaxID=3367526 RepID=UPI0037544EA9
MTHTGKLASMAEAARAVPDGASLTFSGFGHSGHPMAFVRELVRQGRGGFTLHAVAECWPAEFLTGAGRVRRINLSNLMFEGLGRCRAISRAVETGAVAVDDHSHLALWMRLSAAGWDVPFLPLRSMAGTDLARIQSGAQPKYAQVESPFGDGPVGVVSPLQPDVAVIHVNKADDQGNGVVYGAISVIDAQVRSAKTVIVTAERIVPADEIVADNQLVAVPGILVDAVVHAPFGSHPGAMYREYDEDVEHMAQYYAASRDERTLAAYFDDYVLGTADHDAYLARFGARRLFGLIVDPALQVARRGEGA